MSIRGTVQSVNGRRITIIPEGGGDPVTYAGDPKGPLKVVRQGPDVEHPSENAQGPVPSYTEANSTALKSGTRVRLMGLKPSGDSGAEASGSLHTVVIEPEEAQKAKAAKKVGTPAAGGENLDEMTVAELHEMARDQNVNLHGASTKDEIIREIRKAQKRNK